jgi:hypothetical protein
MVMSETHKTMSIGSYVVFVPETAETNKPEYENKFNKTRL